MKRLVWLLVLIGAFSVVKGQEEAYDISSPKKSVYNHLFYLQQEQYEPQVAALSLANKKVSLENPSRAAIQLIQIYDGKGIKIDLSDIPDELDYVDSISQQARYVVSNQIPELYLVRQGNKWVYSEKSINSIAELHSQIYPGGLHRLMNAVPKSWHSQFLGLQIGQWIGVLLILLLSILGYKLLSWFARWALLKVIRKVNKAYVSNVFLQGVVRPLSGFLVLGLVKTLVPALLLPIDLNKYLMLGLNIWHPLLGTLVFYRLVGFLADYFGSRAQRTEGKLDDQLVPLVSKFAKVLVILIGVAYILTGLGVDVSSYLVGVSIGGLAIALAAQDTLKNLFGSAMIFLDRPFQIGDWINYNGMDGTVEEVGFRSTRVRTFYNSIITVPNGKLADSHVDNYGMRIYRRYSTHITITYDTPPERIEVFIEGLREIVRNHPNTRKDYYEIHMNDLGASALEILFYIFFETPDWGAELKARHEVLMAVIRLANELGIRFAFPTQTVHIEDLPGQSSLTPTYNESKAEVESTMKDFIAAWKASNKGQGSK